MQEKSKILVAISLLLIVGLLFFNYVTYQPVGPAASSYCDEWYETYKIGTTIEYLHFHTCKAGGIIEVKGWKPSQTFKEGTPWFWSSIYAPNDGDVAFPFHQTLNEAGMYRFTWSIEGGGVWGNGVSGSGHGFTSEQYKTTVSIVTFTVPESVNAGEEITASYSIKNVGDLTGQLTITSVEGIYGTGSQIHKKEGIWLGLGQIYNGYFTVDADTLQHGGGKIYMNLYAELQGENPGYPSTWVNLRGTSSSERTIIYTIPTYTLTVTTNPTECDVRIGQNTINSGTTGIATFTGLQSGTYTVNVSKANYTSSESKINIDKNTSIFIVLEKIPEPEPPISTPPVTPGFEALTLIIGLIVTFILLKIRRKKDER